MLRWCQSTAHILNGYSRGHSGIRLHANTLSNKTRLAGAAATARRERNTDQSMLPVIQIDMQTMDVLHNAGASHQKSVRSIQDAIQHSSPKFFPSTSWKTGPTEGNEAVASIPFVNDTLCLPQDIATQGRLQPARLYSGTGAPSAQSHCNGKYRMESLFKMFGECISPTDITCPSVPTLPDYNPFSLFQNIKAQGALDYLSPQGWSDLLSFCGTLSIPRPNAPCIFNSTLVSYYGESSVPAGNWRAVLEIGEGKMRMGYDLEDIDRYWVMRARLAGAWDVNAKKLQSGCIRSQSLYQASTQYLHLKRYLDEAEVHVPYFDALLRKPNAGNIALVVGHLCDLLEICKRSSWLSNYFWQTFVKHGYMFAPDVRQRVLSLVSGRLPKPTRWILKRTPTLHAEKYRQTDIAVTQCSAAFSQAVLPSEVDIYASRFPSFIIRWAIQQAHFAFAPSLPVEVRWDNLMLLAICYSPAVPSRDSKISQNRHIDSSIINWRTVLALTALNGALISTDSGLLESRQREAQKIVRALWRAWKSINHSDVPIDINRAFAASFFQLAAKLVDKPLMSACARFCSEKNIWANGSGFMTESAKKLAVSYVVAYVSCIGKRWPNVYATLTEQVPDPKLLKEIVGSLVRYFISEDLSLANEFFLFGQDNGILPVPAITHELSLSLASAQQWDLVVPFFSHPQLSGKQIEDLLVAVLSILYMHNHEYVDPPLCIALMDTMLRLYRQDSPADRFKYPIRFFLSKLTASGHASRVLEIVEAIHRTTPGFFTMRWFSKLLHSFVRHGKLPLSLRLFRMIQANPTTTTTQSLADARRKLTFWLSRTGAHRLARISHHSGISWLNLANRESLIKTVDFRTKLPTHKLSLGVIPLLARLTVDASVVQYAVTILMNAGRPRAARTVFEKHFQEMSVKDRTTVCNIILHGPLRSLKYRNARLVRRVMHTKNFLMKKYDFVPDRTTVNILLKAVLKWHTVINALKIKILFDHMIREGYPATKRWRRDHNVPFGTPPSLTPVFALPPLSPHISFEKHVRPLYKMFIKMLHLRGDPRAAKLIIGILREEEVIAIQEREKRNRARRLGIAKKKQKALISNK